MKKLAQLATYCELYDDDEFALSTRIVRECFSVSFRDAGFMIRRLIDEGRIVVVRPQHGCSPGIYRNPPAPTGDKE